HIHETMEDTMEESASLDAYLFNRHERPLREQPGDDRLTGRTVQVAATDGVRLTATVWDPSAPSSRTVVIASATGVKRRYYAPFASWLAKQGFSVVTFDYRGIGDSRSNDATPTMHDWGERDLAGVLAWTASELGAGRASILGHSVGGQLIGLLPDLSRLT